MKPRMKEPNRFDVLKNIGHQAVAFIGESSLSDYGESLLSTLFEKKPDLLGRLVAARIYTYSKRYLSIHEPNITDEQIVKYLEGVTLCLKRDEDGQVYTEVEGCPRLSIPAIEMVGTFIRRFPYRKREKKDSTTIYQIQNLNLYLNADVIHQLNVNPKEVINKIHEQLKDEVSNIELH